MHIVGTWVQMYILSYASVHMYTGIWVHSSRFSSRSVRSCCSHFYCITSLNLNRAEPSFGSHGCSPGSHWHLAALRGWLSATRKHSQTKKTHTHMHTHTGRAKATCSRPFPRSCSELFARLSLSFFLWLSLHLVATFGSTRTTTATATQQTRTSTTATATATVACLCLYHFLPCLALKARQASREQRSNPKRQKQQTVAASAEAVEAAAESNTERNQCRKQKQEWRMCETNKVENERANWTKLKCNLLQ